MSGQLKDEDAESKEHRESLKRQKTSSVTTDEEQDTTTVRFCFLVDICFD